MRRARLFVGAFLVTACVLPAATIATADEIDDGVVELYDNVYERVASGEITSVIVDTHYPDLDARTGLLDGVDYLPGQFVEEVNSVEDLDRLVNTDGVDGIHVNEMTSPQSDATNAAQGINTTFHANSYTGTGQAIVILDTGFDTSLTQAFDSVLAEVCFSATGHCGSGMFSGGGPTALHAAGAADAYPSTYAGYEHGTLVACVAFCNNTGNGATGVAPDASQIIIRTASPDPVTGALMFSSADTAAAINWVNTNRNAWPGITVSVINQSANSNTKAIAACPGGTVDTAVQSARNNGILTVFPTGNNGWSDGIATPACVSSAVVVTGYSETGAKYNWFGNGMVDAAMFVPDAGITTLIPGGSVIGVGGSSVAAPQMAGVLALMSQVYVGLDDHYIEGAIRSGGDLIRDVRANVLPSGGAYSTRQYSAPASTTRAQENANIIDDRFNPIEPVRIVETWGEYGSPLFASGQTVTVNLATQMGVWLTDVDHLIAQVTLWGDGCTGVIGHWPTGSSNPGTAGTITPGGVVSTRQPINVNGVGQADFKIYGTCTGVAPLHYAIDVVGFFGVNSDVVSMAPERPINGKVVAAGAVSWADIGGVGTIPSNADGVYGMWTVVQSGSGYGFHDIAPAGGALGGEAPMIAHSSGMRNNLVYVDLHSTGEVDIWNCSCSAGAGTYYFDVYGYTLSGGAQDSLKILNPTRVYDSRPSNFISASTSRTAAITNVGGIPSTAKAVVANFIAMDGTSTPSYNSFVGAGITPRIVDINAAAGEYRVNSSVIRATCASGCVDFVSAKLLNPSSGTGHFAIETMAYMP